MLDKQLSQPFYNREKALSKAVYRAHDFEAMPDPIAEHHEGTLDWLAQVVARNASLADTLEADFIASTPARLAARELSWQSRNVDADGEAIAFARKVARLRRCCRRLELRDCEGSVYPWAMLGEGCGWAKACRYCARTRTGDLIRRLLPRLAEFSGPDLADWAFVTLTQPAGPDLAFQRAELQRKWVLAVLGRDRRGKPITAFRSEELTISSECGWHVHYHALVYGGMAAGERLVQRWLLASPESSAAAQDVRLLDPHGFWEVCKYSLKISGLPVLGHAAALPCLEGGRMAQPSGGLMGQNLEEVQADLADDKRRGRLAREWGMKRQAYVFDDREGVYVAAGVGDVDHSREVSQRLYERSGRTSESFWIAYGSKLSRLAMKFRASNGRAGCPEKDN